MHGIELKSGVNNCYWNIDGKCTNPKITKEKVIGFHDWNSTMSCVYTILGCDLCSGYLHQKHYTQLNNVSEE